MGESMTFGRSKFFSFIVKTTGEVIAAMPDEEEFSVQQIRDHVAGPPEVICETREGFLLFRNRDANALGLEVNPVATSVYSETSGEPSPVNGRVFVAHPQHVAAYWRRAMKAGAGR